MEYLKTQKKLDFKQELKKLDNLWQIYDQNDVNVIHQHNHFFAVMQVIIGMNVKQYM